MSVVKFTSVLPEDIRKELNELIPDFDKELLDIRAKLQAEVAEIVADVITKTVEGLIIVITKIIQTFGFLIGEYEIHKEFGKRAAMERERPTLLQPADGMTAFYRGLVNDGQLRNELALQGYSDDRINVLIETLKTLLSSADIRHAYIRNRIAYPEAIKKLGGLGYDENEAQILMDTAYKLLEPVELVQLWLRGHISEDELTIKLDQNGYTDESIDYIKRLSEFIPPAQDLIRMAVREAFSPDVAQAFGQYDDFPEEFSTHAAKHGISDFWARAYWAAHWDLPSPQMGFEMLHRGIISRDELELLLRALDVMPFWREKVIQLSYAPLTRIDVRRMYKLGVINRDEVHRAFLDIGYSEENAERLTHYVEVEAMESERDLTKSELIAAYENGMLNDQEFRDYLKHLRYGDVEIEILVSLTEFKKEKKLRDAKLKAIKSRYMNNVYDRSRLITELTKLGLPASELDTYVETWTAEYDSRAAELPLTDLRQAVKLGVIDYDNFYHRVRKMGYNHDDTLLLYELTRKGGRA